MPKRHSEFIDHLGKLLEKMSSAQLSELAGVADSRIPEWKKGRRLPSANTLIKMGGIALQYKLDDPFFFWSMAGVDPQTLRVMAARILQIDYEIAGDTVPIKRFRETIGGREEAGLPIPLPVEFVPNPSSTICLVMDEKATAVSQSPKGVLLVDTSIEGTEDPAPLWGHVVVASRAWRQGSAAAEVRIYAGRLELESQTYGLSKPNAISFQGQLVFLERENIKGRLDLGSYEDLEGMSGVTRDDRLAWSQRMDEIKERARCNFRMIPEVKILGKVIGRLTGHLEGPAHTIHE